MTGDCPRDLTFPCQPYFDSHVFENSISLSLKIKGKLSCNIFHVLRSLYGVFIRINYFWLHFGRFSEVLDKSRNPRRRTKMAAVQKWLRNYYVMWRHSLMMRTSKETFWMYYLPSKSYCHSFYIHGVTEGWGGGTESAPLPPDRRRPKKARSE